MQYTYLAHHGILGQKWGVRRFQNEDGSLTAAGRAHYGVGKAKSSALGAYRNVKKKLEERDRVKASKKEEKKTETDINEETNGSEEETEERKGLTKGQKVAIAIAATAVTLAVIKTVHDKGGKDYVEDMLNSNQKFSNIQRKAVIAKEAHARNKMVNKYTNKYGQNDPEFRKAMERTAMSRDRAKLRTEYRDKTVHRKYDTDYINVFEDAEYRKELRKGYDEVVKEARPAKWVANIMNERTFKDATDAYFNQKAEEQLKKWGIAV